MKQYPKYKDSGVSWIGEIPERWNTRRLKFSCNLIQEKTTDSSLPYIALENIESYSGKLLSTNTSIPEGSCNLYSTNDVLFSKLRPYLTKCVVAPSEGKCSSELLVLRDFEGENKYLQYLMLSPKYIEYIDSSTYGAKMPRANWLFIGNTSIPLPPLSEQHAIVSYLDKKTAQIDRFISEATKEIEKLNELKQAQVAHLVTHGTNPDAPMKDSGIAWIGQIPEHWKKARYKDVLSIQDEKVGKRKDLTLLSLTKQGVIIRDLAEMKGKFPKDFESYKVVHPDNIILCLFDVDETPRTVGLSHNEGMITGAYDVFSIKNIDKEYFLYHYLSLDDRKAMKPLYKGLRKTIPLPRLMGEHIFIPPASEQKAIVSAINSLNNKIETLVSELTTQIDHLKELKQRIISDAVTGKIDVREVNN